MKYTVILRTSLPRRETSSMRDFRDFASAELFLHRIIGEYVCAQFVVLGSAPSWASLRLGDRTVTAQLISLEA